MELQPRRQPGRNDRKAAVYASEIVRLRSAGYTYEAIREALADVGIELSTSALRREVRRLGRPSAVVLSVPQPALATEASPAPSAWATATPHDLEPARCPGHAIAEAFFNAHPSNPLLRNQEIP